MTFERLLRTVDRYYTEKLRRHGATAKGVDWNSAESQFTRFAELLRIVEGCRHFVINDYGCGYGALLDYLQNGGREFQYRGYDVSAAMVAKAQTLHPDSPACRFYHDASKLRPADYTVASGIFNVRGDVSVREWEVYVLSTLDELARLSNRGFAFNVLTCESDPERRRPDLYYADPCTLFSHCQKRFSRWAALLHDYGLYEFTILVRRRGESSWRNL